MDIRELTERGLAEAAESNLPCLDPTVGQVEPLRIAAIIGFAGDQLRGTVALAVGLAGLRCVRDRLGAPPEQSEDSLGEMANLIAGHLKRTLARHGQIVTITPPIVVRGVTIEVCSAGQTRRVEHERRSADARMVTWLDYDAADDLVLTEATEDATVAEGESLFF